MSQINAQHWQPALNDDGVVEQLADIHQSIRIIVTTPLGADPLRPEFGCGANRYLDYPVDRARPHVVREVVAAVRRWEPRVELVQARLDWLGESHAGMRVRWRALDEEYETEVTL